MKRETEIHQQFIKWLVAKRYGFIHSRTDRKTTTEPGDPDFLVCKDGRCVFIEIKVPGGKMSETQIARRKELMATGNIVEIAYSLEDCIMAVEVLLAKDYAL